MPFHWERISKGLAKDLARAVGLRVSVAGQDLSAKFGEPPGEDMVEALWPTLRDRWLGAQPVSRERVVRELRNANLGDATIKVATKAGQMHYLRSCRQSARLRTIVLSAFLEQELQAGTRSDADESVQSSDLRVLVRRALETMTISQETGLELALASAVTQFVREFCPPQPAKAEVGARQLAGCLVQALASSMECSENAGGPVAAHRARVVEGAHRLAQGDSRELVEVFLGLAHRLLEDPKGNAQGIIVTSVRAALVMIASALSVPTAELKEEIEHGTNWLTARFPTLVATETGQRETDAAARPSGAHAGQHGSARECLAELLHEVLGSPPVFDEDGDVPIGKGSARLFIRILEDDVPVPVVQIFGKLVQGVQPTYELLADVNEASTNLFFSRIVSRKEGVFLEGNVPAESLSSRELAFLVHEAVCAADHFDSLLASRHQGSTLGTDAGELMDV